jgi:hypothetical protein
MELRGGPMTVYVVAADALPYSCPLVAVALPVEVAGLD